MSYDRERPWIGSLKHFAKEMRKHSQWMRNALCATPKYREYPWFSEEDAQPHVKKANRKLLKQVCAYCPVQAECNTFAKNAGVTAGVWAGHYYGG
jgi:Transcription factor WhiB